MTRPLVRALCLFFLLTCPAWGWDATTLSVHDGDTITVKRVDTGQKVTVRLYGIDAPEGHGSRWKPQPYSKRATQFVQALLPAGTSIAVVDMGFDKYSRTVGGIVRLPDGQVAQEEILQAGLAWVYPQYCKNCTQWKDMQAQAQKERRGLWKDPAPVPPWQWRKGSK